MTRAREIAELGQNLTVDASGNAEFSGDIELGDNNKAIFGAGSDLQIYHETSTGNSRIVESGTGHLNIEASNLNLKTPTGENYINCTDNGNVLLRYDNAQKLATTSTGIDVTGEITTDGMTTSAVIKAPDGSAAAPAYTNSGDSDGGMYFPSANQVSFASGGVQRLNINNVGDISFYEDTGTTAKFHWSAADEFVGIGTTSQTGNGESLRLVNGLFINTAGTEGVPSVALGDTNSGLFAPSAGNVAITTQGSERLIVTNTGNVGIGVTPETDWQSGRTVVQIGGNASLSAFTSQGAGNFARLSNNVYRDGTGFKYISTDQASEYTQADGVHIWSNAPVGTAGAAATLTEAMRIDSSGSLLVGKTATGINVEGFEATSAGYIAAVRDGGIAAYFQRKTSDGSIIEFRKDGTTVGSIGVTSSGANIYYAGGSGKSGVEYGSSAWIPWYNGARSDNFVDLGAVSLRFNDIYATNGTIQTSDRNEKQDIEALSDAEQRVAVACRGLLRKFRWKGAVAEKGDDARIHFGIIAQDLQDAFAAEGLDSGDYAMFISSTWTDEETGEERTRMGVRYSELLAFIIAAI